MQIKEIYQEAGALLEGHFLLSSGKHSKNYLQSAKILEDPKTAKLLASKLAELIKDSSIKVDTVCAPAIGGLLIGYELARALGTRYIFTERVQGEMTLRRGFEVKEGERILVCEDIITTGKSALEAAREVEKRGAVLVGLSAIANRGFCKREGSNTEKSYQCVIPDNVPLFALEDFIFETYEPDDCPLCKSGSIAIKPGSRGN